MNIKSKLIIIAITEIFLAGILTIVGSYVFNSSLQTSGTFFILQFATVLIVLSTFLALLYKYIIGTDENSIKTLLAKNEHYKNILKQKASQSWEEEARFAASIQSLPIGFIMTNGQGDIISANNACQSILNTEGQDLFSFKINNSLTLKEAINKALVETETVKYGTVPYNEKYLDITITPITDKSSTNKTIGMVTLINDITESKIAERSKDEFFSIASHELRTPLTAIRSNTAIIRDYYNDKIDPEIKEIFDDIHEATIRLIKIVNDFLNTSRLEQGRMQFKIAQTDVTSLIEDCIKDLQPLALEKNISLTYTKPNAEIPLASCDPDKTKEVIVNLLSNGIKYTEKGSVTIKMEDTSKQIKIIITDTGRGIPEQNKNLLFRKFQQASDNILTRDSTQSSGLGLYISKLIAEGMKGALYLEDSAEGKGSTFVFTVPKESI